MRHIPKRKAGQAMVEYIIIVVVVAVGALVLFGIFGDTIQRKMGGVIDELEGDNSGTEAVESSKGRLQQLGKTADEEE